MGRNTILSCVASVAMLSSSTGATFAQEASVQGGVLEEIITLLRDANAKLDALVAKVPPTPIIQAKRAALSVNALGIRCGYKNECEQKATAYCAKWGYPKADNISAVGDVNNGTGVLQTLICYD